MSIAAVTPQRIVIILRKSIFILYTGLRRFCARQNVLWAADYLRFGDFGWNWLCNYPGSHRRCSNPNTFLTLCSWLMSFWNFALCLWGQLYSLSSVAEPLLVLFLSQFCSHLLAQHAYLSVTEACRGELAFSSQLSQLFEAVVILLVVLVIPDHPELVLYAWVTTK